MRFRTFHLKAGLAGLAICAGSLTMPHGAAALDIGYNALRLSTDGMSQIVFADPTGSGGPITVGLTGNGGPGVPDMLLQRHTMLPDGDTGTIQTEMIALDLRGNVSFNLGGRFYDLFLTLGPTNRSTGQLDVIGWDDSSNSGGTYDAAFDVFLQVALVNTQTGQTDFDFLLQRAIANDPHFITLDGPRYYHSTQGLGALPLGGMYLDPFSMHTADKTSLVLSLVSLPVPEPPALAGMLFGLVAVGALARRRRQA